MADAASKSSGKIEKHSSDSSAKEDSTVGLILYLDTAGAGARDELEAFLCDAGFEVDTVHSASDAIENLVRSQPSVFLHNWSATKPDEGAKIHRTLNRSPDYDAIIRIVLVSEVTPQLLAIAHDYNIDKIVPDSILENDLVSLIAKTKNEKREDAEVSELLGTPARSKDYSRENLDKNVIKTYQLFPEKARVKFEYGSYLVRNDKLDEAEELSNKLISSDPQNVRAMNLLARVYMKQKRFSKAIEVLKKAEFISPDNPDRLVLIGDALYEKGAYKEAKSSYEQALDIEPDSKDAQNGLGMVYVSLGDVEKALDCFKKCLSEDETASFFNNAAVLAVKSSKTMEGLKLYETALKSLQTADYAHVIFFNIALAFYRIDETEQAIEALKASLQYNPTYGKARKLLEKIMEVAS